MEKMVSFEAPYIDIYIHGRNVIDSILKLSYRNEMLTTPVLEIQRTNCSSVEG